MTPLADRPLSFVAALDFEARGAEEVVESLIGLGYGAVEWTMAHVDSLRGPSDVISAHQDLVADPVGGLERTRTAIEAAHDAEIGIVNVVTGPNLWEPGARPGREADLAPVLSALNAACEHAAPLGVTVALEPCWGTLAHDAESARRVLAEVPCSVTFDPSHFAISGDDQPALIREWGERIVHVHLKDAFGAPGTEGEDFIFCMLGEGRVPWPEVFTALEEVGYAGALSVEFEAYGYYESVLGSDPVEAARLGIQQARALLGRPVGGGS